MCRQLLQDVCELLCVHAGGRCSSEDWDGDHHPIIGLRDLQGQVIRGEILLDFAPARGPPRRQHFNTATAVVGQQC